MATSLSPYISRFDEGFDVGKSSQYGMTIQFHLGGFSYALLDTASRTLIGLEYHQLDYHADSKETFLALDYALESKGLGSKDLKKITCLIDERTNTLVPNTLHDEKEAAHHLGFVFQLNDEQVVLSEPLLSEQCTNVFAVPKSLLARIRSKWPTAHVGHSSSVFINSSLKYAPEGKAAFVSVRNRDFDLAIVSEGRLAFFNNFRFNTKEDFAYFLLFALEQNNLSGVDVPVCFSGLILPSAEIVQLCSRYVKHLVFVETRNELQVSAALKEIPFQYYYLHYQALR